MPQAIVSDSRHWHPRRWSKVAWLLTTFFEGRLLALDIHCPTASTTIPEISMIGKTEQELTEAKVPYEVGIARYDELAKGQMVGDETGMLRILFHVDTLKVLGVHAIGESATEIIHIAQTALTLEGTIEFFRDSVINYPTFAEAYKVAALNGLNKL
jgi:NAD(P) transhydrogenase